MLSMEPLKKLLGVFALLSLAFVSEAFPSEYSRASAVQAPTLKELKNASYSGIEGLKGSVKLVDGRWTGRPYGKGSASRPVVSLVGDLRVIGDLDNDGTDDAVVLLNYRFAMFVSNKSESSWMSCRPDRKTPCAVREK